MALAEFNLRQLLEAGVHFGHQKKRWNPLMEPFIYGARNGIHIIDLTQTVPLLDAALQAVTQTVAKGGIILFVGTKRQAQKAIAEAAEKSAQYYMNHRWLGGTLTNWKTVSNSISRLKKIDEQLDGNTEGLTKKERLNIEREQGKLQASLGGIREMGGTPDLVFVIDTNKESLAIKEAQKLGIPVVAVIDTNSNPEGIDFPIPGNDDAARSISLYCDLVARAALDGMESQLGAAGVDIGEKEDLPAEEIVEVSKSVGKDSEASREKVTDDGDASRIDVEGVDIGEKENLPGDEIAAPQQAITEEEVKIADVEVDIGEKEDVPEEKISEIGKAVSQKEVKVNDKVDGKETKKEAKEKEK